MHGYLLVIYYTVRKATELQLAEYILYGYRFIIIIIVYIVFFTDAVCIVTENISFHKNCL